jgi:hypothetical protein
MGEQESGTGPLGGRRALVPVGGSRRVNMVQKYVHIYVNAKMIPFETIPGIG